jgi:sugar lactone lactonase YvrE
MSMELVYSSSYFVLNLKHKVMRIKKMSRVLLMSIGVLLFQACSLKPLSWTPQEKPELIEGTAENELLKSATHLSIGNWYGPEDIAIGKDGSIYCGVHVSKNNFKDGRILRLDTNGVVSVFCNTGAWVTGLHFDANENLIACDQKQGLISVDKEGRITVLVNKDEKNQPILLPNDIDIARDGIIYFSSTSSKLSFSRKHARKILMEVRPDGGLYSYNPVTKTVKTLIDSSFFGNGVAVSQDNDFVLMVDLTKYRIVRYWLKGDNKGKTDIFMDNLPGLPNGISRRKDGTFWLGYTTRRSDLLDKIQSKKTLKTFIYTIPLWLQPRQEPFGMIMNISEKGKILKSYYDTTGKIVSEASSIEEHNGYLYLGGDLINHINKYKIEN